MFKRSCPASDTNVQYSTEHAKAVHYNVVNRRDIDHEGHFIAGLPDTLISMISEFIGNDSVCTLGKISARTSRICWSTWSKREFVGYKEYIRAYKHKINGKFIRLRMIRHELDALILKDDQMSSVTHYNNRLRLPFRSSKLPTELVELIVSNIIYDTPLPSTLTKLHIYGLNHSPPVGVSSSKLFYNQPLQCGDLPSSLITLCIPYNKLIQVGVLPHSITELDLSSFDQPLQIGVLPNSLTTLTMKNIDQPLQIGVLPTSLTTLTLGKFDQPLQIGVLPSSITTLALK